MFLSPGTRLGPYEVVAPLGAGGMGEVYRARDTELGRDVAIKVLPPAVAQDSGRLIRFRRESQLLASLNHPNIASIYGVADGDGIRGLVLELVEGETLAETIAPAGRGLPPATVSSMGRQIADALAAAHDKGIIHRDLKPANIKITPAGVVKLLDFGLGKDLATDGANVDPAAATVGPGGNVSFAGMIVGTVRYMSPEQVRGEPLDPRTDLFSLGVVLYEMSTGRPPFGGAVTSVIFDAILNRTPAPPSQLNPAIPPALDRIILKLLEKNRDVRYATASDVRAELGTIDARDGRAPTTRRGLGAVIALGTLTLAILAGLTLWNATRRAVPAASEYVQVTRLADSAVSPALSPDGRMLAFIRGPDPFFGPGQIYVKALPDGEPVPLTRDGLSKMSPVFSPDGARIAYTTVDTNFSWDTWVVPVVGSEPRLWLKNTSGVSWMDQGHILFSEMTGTALQMRLAAATDSRAQSRTVYRPADATGMVHRSSLSPDGKSVLLAEMVDNVFKPCRMMPVDGTSVGRRVGPDGQCTAAAWSPDGRWMFFSARVSGAFHIWRQGSPDGRPEQLTTGPSEEEGIAVAPDGRSLLTSLGTHQSAIWIHDAAGDREVSGEGYAFVPTMAPVMSQPFSPDARKFVYLVRQGAQSVRLDQRSGALWIADLETGRRVALFPGFEITSYDLSRDGQRIVFAALDDKGRSHLWVARLDGQLAPHQISSIEADSPRFGARDDIFFRREEETHPFLYRMREDGSGIQKAVAESILFFMSVSPDGAWLLARVPPGPHAGSGVVAFSTEDGRAAPVCTDCEADWSPGGASFVMRSNGRSVVIPVTSEATLPNLPAGGVRVEADAVGLTFPVGDGFRYPGRDASQYAYMKASIQRNIYRVPLP